MGWRKHIGPEVIGLLPDPEPAQAIAESREPQGLFIREVTLPGLTRQAQGYLKGT